MARINMRVSLTAVLSLAVAICGLVLHVPLRADVIMHFSELSSDATDPADMTASALYSIAGSDLDITIDNTSAFSVAQLFFNSDVALSALSFDPFSGADPAWSITGLGASQTLGGDGFGMYNWLIDFGSDGSRLGPGMTSLALDMTGVTSEATIATKLSDPPPGDTASIGAMKFKSGPGDDSAFGSAQATEVMIREITSFSGMTTSVPFTVDGAPFDTGKVVLSLDPTAENFFALDSELLQGFIDVTLELEFPDFLFPELLGTDPILIRVIENGPVTIDPFEDETGFFFNALLSGGGTIEEGLFAGLTFTNVNEYSGVGSFGSLIVSGQTPVTWSLNGSGQVTFPPSLGGGTETIDGSGDLNVVPEPSGMLLCSTALVGLLACARRRKRGRKN